MDASVCEKATKNFDKQRNKCGDVDCGKSVSRFSFTGNNTFATLISVKITIHNAHSQYKRNSPYVYYTCIAR